MEYSQAQASSIGCGTCELKGPLTDIQQHFLNVRVNKQKNETEENVAWSQEETKLLLDLYEQYMEEIGPRKKFKNKKAMWLQMSQDINEKIMVVKSPQQCENRYKTVLRRKKESVNNNHKSGQSRHNIEYENELSKIAAKDDSVEPEILCDAKQIKKIIKVNREVKENEKPKKQKRPAQESIHDTLRDIAKEREEARERRHKKKNGIIG